MKKLNILLADDHSLMRMGLSALISSEPDMCVIGEAEDGEKTIRLAERLRPDIIIMDLMMPVIDGAEATRRIHDAHPEIKILILTSYGDSVHLLRAINNGASGAQLKESPTDGLVDAIRKLSCGKRAIAPDVQRILDAYPEPPSLTNGRPKFSQPSPEASAPRKSPANSGLPAAASSITSTPL